MLGHILLSVGIFGLLGLSFLWPLVAFAAYSFQRRDPEYKILPSFHAVSHSSIDIMIPAHNEAQHIGETVESVTRAIQHAHRSPLFSSTPIRIHVGADGCTDETVRICKQFSHVSVTESAENKSKWATLKTLLGGSSADWVIFVDSGTRWPKSLLTQFMEQMDSKPRAIAVAPSYQPFQPSWMHRILWGIEKTLKSLESFSGGPVSLHGATVAYRTSSLKSALAYLHETRWLNDDVVIPLVLRALFPDSLIVYPIGRVQDAGARQNQLDLNRRKRMLLGNLQWAKALLPNCFRLNPVAGLLALRRVFRLFWAYWLTCFAVAIALALHIPLLPGLALMGILVAISGLFRQLAGAAWVSLLAPFRMASPQLRIEGSWK